VELRGYLVEMYGKAEVRTLNNIHKNTGTAIEVEDGKAIRLMKETNNEED